MIELTDEKNMEIKILKGKDFKELEDFLLKFFPLAINKSELDRNFRFYTVASIYPIVTNANVSRFITKLHELFLLIKRRYGLKFYVYSEKYDEQYHTIIILLKNTKIVNTEELFFEYKLQ